MNPKFNPELYGTRSDLLPIEDYQNLEKLFQFAPYIAFLVIILSFFAWYLKLPPEQKENFKNSIIPSIKIGLAIIGFTIICRSTQEIIKNPLESFVISLILFSLLPVIVYLLKRPLQKLKVQKDK
jgi:predicted Na+-dependent transporter